MKPLRPPEAGMKTPRRPPEVEINFRTLTATEMECGRIRDALMDVWRSTEAGTIMSGDLNGPGEDDASSPKFPKTRNVS